MALQPVPYSQILQSEGAADWNLNIIGSLAERLYVTWAWNSDLMSVCLYLWMTSPGLQPTEPTLVDTLDIGYRLILETAENDSGTVGMYLCDGNGDYWMCRVRLAAGSLLAVDMFSVPVLDLSLGNGKNFLVSADGLEFITNRESPEQGTVEGWAVDGTASPSWQVNNMTGHYLLGSPRAGTFIAVNDTQKTGYEYRLHSTVSQVATGTDWEITYNFNVPARASRRVVAKWIGYDGYCSVGMLFWSVDMGHPPRPSGGGTVTMGGVLQDADLSNPTVYSAYDPFGVGAYGGWQVWLAAWRSVSVPASVLDEGVFSVVVNTTTSVTGGEANTGWVGYMLSPYAPSGHGWDSDFGVMYQWVDDDAKAIKLIDSSGAVLDRLGLPGSGTPNAITGAYPDYYLPILSIGADDAIVLVNYSEYRILTYANDVLALSDLQPTGIQGSEIMMAAWRGQLAIVSFTYPIYNT
jgi:hypothetical protein